MAQSRCCNDQVGLREGVASLALLLDQEPPLERDILGDFEHTLFEHWPDLVREPVVERRATDGVRDELDAEAERGEATVLT